MKFKNEKTKKSCELWLKYHFCNEHPLKDEKLFEFLYCLCEYEDKNEDKDSFLCLKDMEESERTKEECEDAFQKYMVIREFYCFLKSKKLIVN